jgi:hypothetical protein
MKLDMLRQLLLTILVLMMICLSEHGRSVTGTMVYQDGRSYHGEWKGGECHGMGSMSYPDGGSYRGQWTMGKKAGHGKMKWGGNDLRQVRERTALCTD